MHLSETKQRTFMCHNQCGTLIITKHRTQKYCAPCAIRRKLETRRNWSKA